MKTFQASRNDLTSCPRSQRQVFLGRPPFHPPPTPPTPRPPNPVSSSSGFSLRCRQLVSCWRLLVSSVWSPQGIDNWLSEGVDFGVRSFHRYSRLKVLLATGVRWVWSFIFWRSLISSVLSPQGIGSWCSVDVGM